MTGFRPGFLVPAIACLALSIPPAIAAAAAGELPAILAASFLAAALPLAVLSLRAVSAPLRRMSRIILRKEAARGASPIPETALATLEAALQAAVGEWKREGEQARAETLRQLAILDGMPAAVLAADRGLNLRLANRSACALFAIDDPGGTSMLKATRSTALETAARKVIDGNRAADEELRLRVLPPGGGGIREDRLFRVLVSPLAAVDETGGGVVVVLEDITRLSRLEQVRKDFVANVSHELRTPIQMIKGFSETLLDDPELDEAHRRHVGIIARNAATMESLTDDLLAIASLENETAGFAGDSGEKTFQPLAPLLDEAVQSVAPLADRRGTAVETYCPAGLSAAVHARPLMRALINLLDNAIKYSPPGSQVRLSARPEAAGAVLEVADEGMGISGEHMARIFERFYRVNRDRSRESGGTGLGLSIVRHVALLHGGTVEAESHASEGSVFRILLPGE